MKRIISIAIAVVLTGAASSASAVWTGPASAALTGGSSASSAAAGVPLLGLVFILGKVIADDVACRKTPGCKPPQ